MKKNYTFGLLIVIIMISKSMFAQDIMDVPPFFEDIPYLSNAITADTTDNGERANLDRIYRLERGKVYIMDWTIFADYPIRLIAGGDEALRPPIVVRGKYSTGQNLSTFFTFTGDNMEHSFNDIIFTGVDLDRKYDTEFNRGLKVAGDNVTVTIENCVMNAWAGLFLEIAGDKASLILHDNIWRNGVGVTHPFWGQQNVCFSTELSKLEVTNNTWFNCGGFWLFQENGIAKDVVIEHNTLFTSAIDLFRMRDLANAKFKSNLFYGTHAYAQVEEERLANWVDSDNEYVSYFTIDTSGVDVLAQMNITESEKNVDVSNNTYFAPQAYKDWWGTVNGVYTPSWMNARTTAMFNDDVNYPNLTQSDNYEMDPNFSDTEMHDWVIEEVVNFCKKMRAGQNATTNRNYDVQTGGDILQMNWPLPESLVYTNAEMLIGGHDGLPVGDLNWFPEKRNLYTGISDVVDNIQQTKIYPNPTNGDMSIEFELQINSQVRIAITDLNGKNALNVLDQRLQKGIQKLNFNLSLLPKGLYLCSISTESQTETQKIILIP